MRVWGLALVWVATAVALQVPGYKNLKRDVHRSHIVKRLDKIAPPHDLLRVQKKLAFIAAKVGDQIDQLTAP